MGYLVGDKVEVKQRLQGKKCSSKTWKVWLMEIVPMVPDANDQVWVAKFTRVSHCVLLQESSITRKISSGFEGFFPGEKNNVRM